MNNKVWHIIPEGDTEDHFQKSEDQPLVDNDGTLGQIKICNCPCEPTIITEESGAIIIVHEAFDNRFGVYFKNIEQSTSSAEFVEKQIGCLNKQWGLKDFKIAMPGHPVYDDGNRYVIYLEPEQPHIEKKRVPFYKDSLKGWIDFIKK